MYSRKFTAILVLSVMSVPAILSAVEPNGVHRAKEAADIETMMNEAESRGLSVVYNTRGLNLPLVFNPVSRIITALNPTTVLKVGVIYSAALYLLTYLFPRAFGIPAAQSARMSSPFDFRYEYIQQALEEFANRAADYVQIPEAECRYRAVCEAATYIATKMPTVNEWAKKVSGAFFLNLANPYSKAWINGMMQIQCDTTYALCEHSPFKTILDKFVAKKK